MPLNKAGSAVLWDMDGTLVDSEPLHAECVRHVLCGLGIDCDKGLPDITGMSAAEVFAHCRERFAVDISIEEWFRRRNSFYVERSRTLLPRPGALELFALIGGLGVAQAIVSNSMRIIVDTNLRAIGLDKLALISISRDDVINGKPDPEPYVLAAHRLGVRTQNCFVVEDSLLGAHSGKAAGMHVLYWPQHGAPAINCEFAAVRDERELHLRIISGLSCS